MIDSKEIVDDLLKNCSKQVKIKNDFENELHEYVINRIADKIANLMILSFIINKRIFVKRRKNVR